MNPAVAIIVFYLLLALAVVVLRGDLTAWPRPVDRALAFAICLGAVTLLLRSWQAQQPVAGPAEDGSSRPRPVWLWWAGLAGLLGFVFLAGLPPVSHALARPLAVVRSAEGRDSPGSTADAAVADGTIPAPDPSGAGAAAGPGQPDTGGARRPAGGEGGEGAGSSRGAGAGAAATPLERVRALVRSRPPWLIALLLLGCVLAAVLLWWLLRRRLAGWTRDTTGGPRPPWHDDPAAPAYVREFCRLCEHLGHPPRPGDTWRDLLARLPAAAAVGPPLEPVAVYHYRVRYEGAAADDAAERDFARLIRAARKAAIFPPATETAPAASAAH